MKNEKKKKLMLRAISRLQNLMLLLVEKRNLAKIEDKIEINIIFSRLSAENIIKKAIILSITLNFLKQKTSCNLKNLHVSDRKYNT